jgi:hypothetical protein
VVKESKTPIVPIVVGVVVGVLALLAAVILIMCFLRRRKRRQIAAAPAFMAQDDSYRSPDMSMGDGDSRTGYYAASHAANPFDSPYSQRQSSQYKLSPGSPSNPGVSHFDNHQHIFNHASPYSSGISDAMHQQHSINMSGNASIISGPPPHQYYEMDGSPKMHQNISEMPANDER